MGMTEQRRRQIARSFSTLSAGTLARLAEDFKRTGDTELDNMAEAEIVARRVNTIVSTCSHCGIESDDARAALACMAVNNRSGFHEFHRVPSTPPAPTLHRAATQMYEIADTLREIADELGAGSSMSSWPCECRPEIAALAPEREPGTCDLCGGRKLDNANAVRR